MKKVRTLHAHEGRECFKSFRDGHGFKGNQCCCNCDNQRSLRSHPWVDGRPMSHRIGWACVCDGLSRTMITISNRHGLCELHEPRRKKP